MAEFTQTYKVNCPSCHSEKVIKVGQRNGYQRYQCRGCDKKFRANGMGPGHRIPVEQMGMAIRLFYSGMSYKQIAESMADAFNIPEPSKATIYEWTRDYTDTAVKGMANHPAQVGDTWVADEMMVTVGGGKMWNWNVMDEDTRYILASHLSKNRNMKAAETVMEKAAGASAVEPKTIKSDRLASYPNAISLVFPNTKHIQSDGIRAEVNNNRSERLQGTFRQRTKTLRGLDSLETGQRYLDGWSLNYNLFRGHEALDDKTPGEIAHVNAPFKEWADVVRVTPAAQRGTEPPKVLKPRIAPMAQAPIAPPVIRDHSTPPPREKPEGQRRLPPRPKPRQFKSVSGRGRPPKQKNPAWLRRGEVRGRY